MREEYLIGRQAIADYANVSKDTVTQMQKAGLKCIGGGRRGSPPRCLPSDIDVFWRENPQFVARDYCNEAAKNPKKQ